MSPVTTYTLFFLLALAGAALYFSFSRGGVRRAALAWALGVAALIGLSALAASRGFTGRPSGWSFYFFAGVSLLAAVRVITHTKPVYSAVYFVLVVVAVAALLLLQSAEFLAVALVIIYAGAILVTYLFVIMLAQQPNIPIYDRRAREPLAGVVIGLALAAAIAGRASAVSPPPESSRVALAAGTGEGLEPGPSTSGNTLSVGELLMARYVVVLELSGVLLLVSMVGAIALSRKRIVTEVLAAKRTLGKIGREAEPF